MQNNKFEFLFPSSMTEKLKNELEDLKSENTQLKKALSGTKKKYYDIKGEMPDSQVQPVLSHTGKNPESTIIELSKKVRELNAKLGAAQSKAKQAETQLTIIKESEKIIQIESKEETPSSLEIKKNEVKDLQEKLTLSSSKLCEVKNQMQQVKQNLELSQKLLASEVGDEDAVQNTLSGNSSSRGRAQQIIKLQQKVTELTTKLDGQPVDKISTVLANERHADKEKMNALKKEVEGHKMELSDMLCKVEASRQRIKLLTSEIGGARGLLNNAKIKSAQDDEMISKLTEQLSGISEKSKEREESLSKTLKGRIKDLSIESKKEKTNVEQMRKIISEQEKQISRLEIQKEEASRYDNIQRFEIDHYNRPVSPVSTTSLISNTPEGEYTKMMDLISTLHKRLEIERSTSEEAHDNLSEEKHRVSKIEEKISKLEMDKVGCTRGSCNSYCKKQPLKTAESNVSNSELELARNKCELLQEKCLTLKTRLDTIKQEKDEETKRYVSLIEDTRTACKDHLRQSKCSTAISVLSSL